jgi:hypothetical protein
MIDVERGEILFPQFINANGVARENPPFKKNG